MMTKWLCYLVTGFLVLFFLGGATGCSQLLAPYGRDGMTVLTDKLGASLEAVANQIADQGILEKYAANAEGEFIEPGVETQAGIIATASVRLRGVSGTLDASAGGHGSNVPSGVREALSAQIAGKMTDEQIRATLLGGSSLGGSNIPNP